jgi:hypothetical protein
MLSCLHCLTISNTRLSECKIFCEIGDTLDSTDKEVHILLSSVSIIMISIRGIDVFVTNKSGLQSFQATDTIGLSSAVVARVLKKVLPGVVTTATVTDGPGL